MKLWEIVYSYISIVAKLGLFYPQILAAAASVFCTFLLILYFLPNKCRNIKNDHWT